MYIVKMTLTTAASEPQYARILPYENVKWCREVQCNLCCLKADVVGRLIS